MAAIASVVLLCLFVLYVMFFSLGVSARHAGDMALCIRHARRAAGMVKPAMFTGGVLIISMIFS